MLKLDELKKEECRKKKKFSYFQEKGGVRSSSCFFKNDFKKAQVFSLLRRKSRSSRRTERCIGDKGGYTFSGCKRFGFLLLPFSCVIEVSLPCTKLSWEVQKFLQFMMFSAPSFAISLHWGDGSVSRNVGTAGHSKDEGDFFTVEKWEVHNFSFPSPRNGENCLFLVWTSKSILCWLSL